MYLDYGNETKDVEGCITGEQSVLHARQAITNLQIAKEFFENPPIVEKPNKEGLTVDIEAIDWSKPVYSADEVKTMLKVCDSTFRRWMNGGWIS